MNKLKLFTVALALPLALSACTGSNGNGIFYSDGTTTEDDYIGKTFKAMIVGRDDENNPIRGTADVRVISLTEIEITIDGTTYTVTDPDEDGSFTGGGVTLDLTVENPDLVAGDFSGDGAGHGWFGFQTDPDDLESVSTGSYFRTNGGYLDLVDDEMISSETNTNGDAYFDINFGTGDVTGAVFDNGFFVMSLVNGSINGSGNLDGELTLVRGGTPYGMNNTDVDGSFFGADAGVLAGTYEGRFDASLDGTYEGIIGHFIADEQIP